MRDEEESAGIDFRKYWGILRKWRYHSLAAGLAVLSVCTWGSFFLKDTYEAKATVQIQKHAALAPLVRSVRGDAQDDMLQNIRDSLTSRTILEKVAVRLASSGGADKQEIEEIIDRLRRRIEITFRVTQGSSIPDYFTIGYKGKSPEQVYEIVNIIVEEFIRENTAFRRSDAAAAFEFVEKQLKEHEAKMEKLKTTNRSAVRVVDPLRVQAATEMQTQMNALNNQLAALMAKYTDEHPDVQRIKAEIADLRQRMPKGGTVASAAPVQAGAAMSDLDREILVNQRIYEDLKIRFENARIARDIELADKQASLRVVEPAMLPQAAARPIRIMVLFAGLAISLVSAIALAVIMEFFNKSFTDEDQIARQLGIEVLAIIPQIVSAEEIAATERFDRKIFVATLAYLGVIAAAFVLQISRHLGLELLAR